MHVLCGDLFCKAELCIQRDFESQMVLESGIHLSLFLGLHLPVRFLKG